MTGYVSDIMCGKKSNVQRLKKAFTSKLKINVCDDLIYFERVPKAIRKH